MSGYGAAMRWEIYRICGGETFTYDYYKHKMHTAAVSYCYDLHRVVTDFLLIATGVDNSHHGYIRAPLSFPTRRVIGYRRL